MFENSKGCDGQCMIWIYFPALVEENKHWLDLKKLGENKVTIKSDPYSCIHVHSVSKCKSNDVLKPPCLYPQTCLPL